jgi:hypothetical protein
MTARRQVEIEAQRTRIREIRAEARQLAAGEGEQLALPGIDLRKLVEPRRPRRRQWVQP